MGVALGVVILGMTLSVVEDLSPVAEVHNPRGVTPVSPTGRQPPGKYNLSHATLLTHVGEMNMVVALGHVRQRSSAVTLTL